MRRWVLAGGNLWISDAGPKLEHLPRIDWLLELTGHSSLDKAPEQDPRKNETRSNDQATRSWQPVTRISDLTPPDPFARSNSGAGLSRGDSNAGTAPPGNSGTAGTKQPTASMRERKLGLGTVVVFPGDVVEAIQELTEAGVVPDFAGPSSILWNIRHGVEPFADNSDFWDWLIPGVGLPPIMEFQILITLFVIGIGPLNYFLLQRKRRLHLLVLSVPVSALIVTLGLIGYATFADGFQTRVRTRSFTELDQQTGEAVCWSRQTYYAGIAPSDGLRFPLDMSVLPKEVGVNSRRRGNQMSGRTIKWGEDQHLAEGWLRSRTTAQFMCIRSRPTLASLELASAPGQPPVVTNRLGTPILHLVLRDTDGVYYAANSIDADTQTTLQPESATSAVADARLAILQAQPQAPATPGNAPPAMAIAPTTNLTLDSRLEAAIEETRQALGGNLGLAPGTYVALVEKSPEVEFGCRARQEDSLHVIRGRW